MGAVKDERKTVTVRLGQKELEFCKLVHQELNLTFSELMLEAIRLFLFVARVIKSGGHLVLVEGEGAGKQIIVPGLEWLKEKDSPKKGGQDGG
jgi:hypothetical protein